MSTRRKTGVIVTRAPRMAAPKEPRRNGLERFRPLFEQNNGQHCTGRAYLMFPHGSDQAKIAVAKALCAGCPFRALCLEWALETGESDGVCGGLTAEERNDLIRPSE